MSENNNCNTIIIREPHCIKTARKKISVTYRHTALMHKDVVSKVHDLNVLLLSITC